MYLEGERREGARFPENRTERKSVVLELSSLEGEAQEFPVLVFVDSHVHSYIYTHTLTY